MAKYDYDIVYVFGKGRKEKLEEKNLNFGLEFFYGYPYLRDLNLKLAIVEAEARDYKKFKIKILKKLDYLLSSASKLTFYISMLYSIENIKKLFKTKNIITSNHGLGNSISILVFIFKLFKKINFVIIVSGLFNLTKTNLLIRIVRSIFLNFYLYVVDVIIFTNRSEYEFASILYPSYNKKYVYIPFCIDNKYWYSDVGYNPETTNEILFIGNNGHRDFNLAIKIANELNQFQFTFITNQIKKSQIISKNIKLIKGDWNSLFLTDDEVKNFYKQAKLVILPIKNTIVSAGQSVGLQAASMGIPLVITDTIGFWDKKIYKDYYNIFFVKSNTVQLWKDKILELSADNQLLANVSKNSLETIEKNFKIEVFNKELFKLLKF